MTHALVVEDGSLLFQLPPTWSVVCDKVFKCTEHSADQNSLSAVPDLWAYHHEQDDDASLVQTIYSMLTTCAFDDECSGRPSIIMDDLMKLVREHIMENCCITVTELRSHFLHISRSLLHTIVTEHLLFGKLCARWMPKQLTPEHIAKLMESALTFL